MKFFLLFSKWKIGRFERERKNEALNEEILVGKYTGEFYIKTKDGIIVSNDILDRTNSSMNNAIRIAEMVGMTGELFKVDFDELELPSHVDYTVNFLNMEPIQEEDTQPYNAGCQFGNCMNRQNAGENINNR